ncbi:MAG: (2Fe-2S) ferredoxin domain-containing protein [Cyanobacteria bacterium]|nr:(2Fe-2S) ferredoxin domain-containing protein [Cyanobacteriota bacterium]
MTIELLNGLSQKATELVNESTRLTKSLDLATSRVTNVLSKAPTEAMSVKAKLLEVCTLGPYCCRRGGTEVYQTLKLLLAEDANAQVKESDCLHHCGQGPNLLLDGILYSGMNEEKARELVKQLSHSSKLPVELIVSPENSDAFLEFEEARSLLVRCLKNMVDTKAALKANIEASATNLPENREERMIQINLLLRAMKADRALAAREKELQVRLAKIVPLNDFVEVVFSRALADWRSAK